MVKRRRLLPIALVLGLIGCASTFPYRYYVPDLPPEAYEKGHLLGPKPKDDLPMSICKPTDADKGPCVVFLRAELQRLQDERLDLLERLKACEEPKP